MLLLEIIDCEGQLKKDGEQFCQQHLPRFVVWNADGLSTHIGFPTVDLWLTAWGSAAHGGGGCRKWGDVACRCGWHGQRGGACNALGREWSCRAGMEGALTVIRWWVIVRHHAWESTMLKTWLTGAFEGRSSCGDVTTEHWEGCGTWAWVFNRNDYMTLTKLTNGSHS